MQQQRLLPTVGPTARMVALSLLVAVFLAMTLVLAQLATRPAPEPPDPGHRCSSGPPWVTPGRCERVGGRPGGPTAALATPASRQTLKRTWTTSPSWTT